MKCKKCGKETVASLCSVCFLEELLEQVEMGEENPSRILKKIAAKFGRLKGLKRLPVFRKIFGKGKVRRVITTETGERCRLVPTYDGWVAVTSAGRIPETEEPGLGEIPETTALESSFEVARGAYQRYASESAEGGRIITYYEGDKPIMTIHTPTSLVIKRPHRIKRGRRALGKPPPRGYTSPIAHERPPSPLD